MRGLWWYKANSRSFWRLPVYARASVRAAVWDLAQCSAGAHVCFRSDTTCMHVRARLTRKVPFPHMPTTGHSGLALYMGGPYQMRPCAVAFPPVDELEFAGELFSGFSTTVREYTLYLPLYNGLEMLDIGLSPGACVGPPSPLAFARPAVFYGTSITQGACAHNPGADFVSVLGRLLSLETINLGFSGNGLGEPEMARLLAEIDACLYVLDYVANVDAARLRETLPQFIAILRMKRPDTPIALMSKVVFTEECLSGQHMLEHDERRDVVMDCYLQARRRGDSNIHFVDGNALIPFGADLAYSDRGVHPSNVGFQMMAQGACTPDPAHTAAWPELPLRHGLASVLVRSSKLRNGRRCACDRDGPARNRKLVATQPTSGLAQQLKGTLR
jgi:hypothetical protein